MVSAQKGGQHHRVSISGRKVSTYFENCFSATIKNIHFHWQFGLIQIGPRFGFWGADGKKIVDANIFQLVEQSVNASGADNNKKDLAELLVTCQTNCVLS